jgi:hypothetical protein
LGTNFLSNIVYEMCYAAEHLKLEFPDELKCWLERIRVPFLYYVGNTNQVFEALSQQTDSNLFVAQYRRTSDGSD